MRVFFQEPAPHTGIRTINAGTLCLALLCVLVSGMTWAQPPDPADVMGKILDEVLAELRDKGQSNEEREADIKKIIYAHFDFRAMSQLTLSTNWRKATPEEKQRFVDKFSRLLLATYIGRVEAYTNERVEVTGRRIKGERAEVSSVIISGDAEIPIRYKMRLKKGQWLVYDVVIEEVSLIRNYRSSYRDIVKKEGIEGLLSRMDEKLAEMNAG